MHLNDLAYRLLLDGALPPADARALAAHLKGDCEVCERFLADRSAADGLDGLVDAALASGAPGAARSCAGDDLEFSRIMQRVAATPRQAGRRIARRAGPALALAATVAVAGVAGLLLSRSSGSRAPWDGTKGTAAAEAVPLRLRFLVLTPAVGGPPSIEKGLSGQQVPDSASLQFEIELGRPAEVLLARVAAGAQDVFFRARLPAGRSAVTVAGQPAAYPLSALAGSQRFLALASEAPIDPADVGRAAAVGAGARHDHGPPISLDQVEVQVLSSMGR